MLINSLLIKKKKTCNPDVLGHSLVHLLVCSHRSLVRLLRTSRFGCALCCAYSLACSLTSLTPSLVGQRLIGWLFILVFFLILAHGAMGLEWVDHLILSWNRFLVRTAEFPSYRICALAFNSPQRQYDILPIYVCIDTDSAR